MKKKLFNFIKESSGMEIFLISLNIIISILFLINALLILELINPTIQVILYSILALSTFTGFVCYFLKKIPIFLHNRSLNWLYFVFLFLFLLVFLYLISNPYEEYLGGRDPGNYISNAYKIAKDGEIYSSPELLVEAKEKNLVSKLFNYEPWRQDFVGHQGYYFVGQYIVGETIVPQFFHFSSIAASILIYFFGLPSAKYFMIIIYLLIMISLYYFLKTFVSKRIDFVFLGILTWLLSPAIFYWSRSFNSESLTLLLILLMVLNAQQYFKKDNLIWGFGAVVCFISAILTRGTPIIFLPLITYMISLSNKKNFWRISAFFLSLISAVFWMIFAGTYPYASGHFAKMLKPFGISQKAIFLSVKFLPYFAFFISLALILLLKIERKLIYEIYKKIKKIIIHLKPNYLVAIAPLTTLLIYQFTMFGNFYSNRPNLIKLSWYTGGILGILIISFGITSLLIKYLLNKNHYHQRIFFIIFILTLILNLLLFLADARISRDHPWWSRRFLTNALLLFPIATTFSLDYFYKKTKSFIIPISIILVMLISNFYYLTPVLRVRKYAGSLDFIEQIFSCTNQKNVQKTIVFDTSYTSMDFNNRLKYLSGYFFGHPLWQYKDFFVIYPPSKTNPIELVEAINNLKVINKSELYVVNPSTEFLNLQNVTLSERCELNFSIEMVGWRSIPEPTKLTEDTKLSSANILNFEIPFKIYKILLE